MQIRSLEIGGAYVRVSTDDQTELSPDAQVRVILDAAKADGYLIPEEFIFVEKKGISGRKADNRPEFQRMIALAKSQSPSPFKRLYVWKFSRFARNQEESVFYKSILRKKCGVDVKSVSEPIMEGIFGRLIESIIEWFDEYYSINLSGEVLRGMTEKALRNGYQSTPPLGYCAVGGGRPFAIDPERIQMVEYIFTSYREGKDMTAISREMNRRGWRTQRGNPFERRTIARILSNRFYVGEVKWNGITFQGSHPLQCSITDAFEGVQQRMASEVRIINRREVSACRHWLSGLLTCYICGSTLSVTRSKNPKRRPDAFQCWKYSKGYHPGSCCIAVKFQSTLPRGERPSPVAMTARSIVFQSTLPRGERLCSCRSATLLEDFNPRSREGSDIRQKGGMSSSAQKTGTPMDGDGFFEGWNLKILSCYLQNGSMKRMVGRQLLGSVSGRMSH